MLVDCISGLPLYELTTPGNVADSSVAAEILAAANQTVSLKECAFLADKGYDVKNIYNTVKTVYEGEAFIPLNPRGTKASEAISVGNPICAAGLAMHKDGKTTDNGRTRQKYCCPFRQSKTGVCPCNHKNWNNGKKNRGCTKYKTIPNDYRLSIDRSCLYFKRTYALRTECERYNSRFKSTGQERLWVRNGASAANLNTLAHISALALRWPPFCTALTPIVLPNSFDVPPDLSFPYLFQARSLPRYGFCALETPEALLIPICLFAGSSFCLFCSSLYTPALYLCFIRPL